MTGWTAGEKHLTTAAAVLAPSVHNTRPWVLEFHDDHVSLCERLDRALPRHDPLGRDQLISCGTADLARGDGLRPRRVGAHP
jgi:hypothetical protein